MSLLEILSPAGSMESLKAAINAGCDALYLGGNSFGARASANNFSKEDMLYAIDYAHVHGKSLYLTINTLLKEEELEEQLYDYLYPYYVHGIDAVIIQDLGVLRFVHQHFKDLAKHASTQMSLTMAQGANGLKEYGVNRLVTSRELSLSEIRSIRDNTDLEIESFVHGALCFSYSGQCLMSSMIGGRSGNRGRCAQTCRMQYKVKDGDTIISNENEGYVLSPKDMCTIDIIPEIVEAGVNSFKIEGRMKRPEYAAGVTYAYRKYLDYYLTYGKEKFKEFANEKNKEYRLDLMMLKDLYNRGGFSKGYYENHNGKKMMTMNRPNHSGICIGKVTNVTGNAATIQLTEDVNAQDIVEFRENEKQLYEFTVKNDTPKGTLLKTNFLRGSGIKVGQLVYRTKNNSMLENLANRFMSQESKVAMDGYFYAAVGQPMMLTLQQKDITITVTKDIVDEAKNQPTNQENVQKQLLKTKDTSFEFAHLEINLEGKVFLPIGKLNEIRRDAINELRKVIAASYRRNSYDAKETKEDHVIDEAMGQKEAFRIYDEQRGLEITVAIHSLSQLDVVLSNKDCDNIYLDMNCIDWDEIALIGQKICEQGKKAFLLLPHIFRKETADIFEENKKKLIAESIHGYVLRNLEEYSFMQRILEEFQISEQKELVLDYNVYVMNHQAKAFWHERGVNHYTVDLELNSTEIKKLGIHDSDFIVYGRVPLMVTAQCLTKNVGHYCEMGKRSVDHLKDGSNQYELIDRCNKSFYVRNHCKYCYNTIYNGDCISLLSNASEVNEYKPRAIRLDFTFERNDEIDKILDAYVRAYRYFDASAENFKEGEHLTRGHFKRGIL